MSIGQGRLNGSESNHRIQLRHRRLVLYAVLTFAAAAGLLSWSPNLTPVKSIGDYSRTSLGAAVFALAPYTDKTELSIKGANKAVEDQTWKLLKDWQFATGRDMQDQRTCLTFEVSWPTLEQLYTIKSVVAHSLQERYRPYYHSDSSSIVKPPTSGTRVAFLQRVRPDRLHTDPHLDMERQQAFGLSDRALVAELQAVGVDVYFLINYPRGSGQSYEEWYNGVFPDYQGRIFSYIQEDWIEQYPAGTFKGEIAYDNQVSLNAFMASDIGMQYDFAWWMEDDVRSTGSWASVMSFLNATLEQSDSMPDLFLTSDYDPYIDEERNKAATGPSCTKFAGKHGLSGSLINLTGFSRKLHDAMMAHYAAGESCQCEIFVATVANHHGLKVHSAQLPSRIDVEAAPNWPESTTWAHWYPHAATIYYDRWQANSSVCRPGPELLHKITYGKST